MHGLPPFVRRRASTHLGPEMLSLRYPMEVPLCGESAETLRARSLAQFHDGVRVRMTEQGEDIVLRGAAVMVLSGQLGVS